MDYQFIFAILFFVSLSVYLYINRAKVTREGPFPLFYMFMLRTGLGLKAMDKYSKKYKTFLQKLSVVGVWVGFLGMIVISGTLIYYLVKSILTPSAAAGVQLVLPFKVKGTFYVPFFYWITCLIIIAFVHEFSHGVVARLHKIPVKSSGFAVMSILVPLVPAAFVEPDEKKLSRKKKIQQLSVFAAGPFSNILIAVFCAILIFGVLRPVNSAIYTNDAVYVTESMPGYAANLSGIVAGDKFVSIDGVAITSVSDISLALKDKRSGDLVEVITSGSDVKSSGILETMSGIDNLTTSEIVEAVKSLKYADANETLYFTSNGLNYDINVRKTSNSDSSYLGFVELRIAIDDSVLKKLDNVSSTNVYMVNLSENPSNSSASYLGVYLDETYKLIPSLQSYSILFKIYDWLAGLIFWLFLLNLGVGLFNLAPLGIVDGGRMLFVGLCYFLSKKNATKVWKVISMFFLIVVISLLIVGFIFG